MDAVASNAVALGKCGTIVLSYMFWIGSKGPEIKSGSVDGAQLSRLLPEDRDRIQSLKRCFLIKKLDDG
jgi:hypothetical protein